MFSFEEKIIVTTVEKLISGQDYRQEIINDIANQNYDYLRSLKCEVKLMGGDNPESADMVIARNSDVFIADTLSAQNKNQLDHLEVLWLELRNHSMPDILNQFRMILKKLNVPFKGVGNEQA